MRSPDAALHTLESLRLRVGRLASLNDPFDCAPHFLSSDGDEFQRTMCDIMPRLFHGRNETLGVVSFTRTWKEPVMWSHYADSHRGIAIVLRRPKGTDLLRVKYSRTRPNIPLGWILDPERNEQTAAAIVDSFNVKSLTWKYEKETRILVKLAGCEVSGGHYFIKIPPDYLIGVIPGLRCAYSPEYVRQLFTAHSLSRVHVWRARKSNTTFALDRELV